MPSGERRRRRLWHRVWACMLNQLHGDRNLSIRAYQHFSLTRPSTPPRSPTDAEPYPSAISLPPRPHFPPEAPPPARVLPRADIRSHLVLCLNINSSERTMSLLERRIRFDGLTEQQYFEMRRTVPPSASGQSRSRSKNCRVTAAETLLSSDLLG
jgi:hypothetical protein